MIRYTDKIEQAEENTRIFRSFSFDPPTGGRPVAVTWKDFCFPAGKNRLTVRFRRFRRVAGDLISYASCEVISLHLICCFRPNAGLALLRSLNRTRPTTDTALACTQKPAHDSNQHLFFPSPPLFSSSSSSSRWAHRLWNRTEFFFFYQKFSFPPSNYYRICCEEFWM